MGRITEFSGRTTGSTGSPNRLRSFDPVRIADLEYQAWVGYYLRRWPQVLAASVGLVRAGFGLDPIRTLHGAWLVLRANQLWAPYPDNDPAGARRCMRRFYALLRLAHGAPADPARAAALEVDWWAAHRARQHDPLVTALTRLYAYLYRTDEPSVRPAARLRAEAMDLSDRWVDQGGAPDSPLIPAVRAALVRSYAALLAEVHTEPRL